MVIWADVPFDRATWPERLVHMTLTHQGHRTQSVDRRGVRVIHRIMGHMDIWLYDPVKEAILTSTYDPFDWGIWSYGPLDMSIWTVTGCVRALYRVDGAGRFATYCG